MSTVFQSDACRDAMRAWPAKILAQVPLEVESIEVTTRFGATGVSLAGARSAPVVVALHGALANSALLMRELAPLAASYRVVCVDVMGQSSQSADRRLDLKDDEYAEWLGDVISALGLSAIHLIGVSWGGFVATKVALKLPYVKSLALLVPAGYVGGPMVKAMFTVVFPLMRYARTGDPDALKRFLDSQFTTRDPLWDSYMADAIRCFRFDFRVPPRFGDDELRHLKMPLFVVGAEHDLSFPGRKLQRRFDQVLPKTEFKLLEGAKHSPPTTDSFRAALCDMLGKFFSRSSTMEPVAPPIEPRA